MAEKSRTPNEVLFTWETELDLHWDLIVIGMKSDTKLREGLQRHEREFGGEEVQSLSLVDGNGEPLVMPIKLVSHTTVLDTDRIRASRGRE